jgi:tetratricopeptide (TPR) repeat protein
MSCFTCLVSFAFFATLATPLHGVEKPSSTVSGVVVSLREEPLAGVVVEFEATNGKGPAPTTATDAQGEFSVELDAGEYVLKLSKTGFSPFEGPISIAQGQRQSVRVQMLDSSIGQRNAAISEYNAGVEAYRAGDVSDAIRHLEASAAADSKFSEPLALLSNIHFDQGSFAESADMAERYLALEPDDREIRTRAYQAYVKTGNRQKIDQWRARLAETGAARQMSLDAYNEGVQAGQAGDYEAAADRFRVALELHPELAEAHAGLATIHYNQSRYADALAAVERALELKSDDAAWLRLRILVHDSMGNRAAADAAVLVYAEVDSAGAVELLLRRAESDFRAGRRQDAEAGLLKALGIEPDHARVHFQLGLVYAQDDTAKAREHLERFISLAPTAPEVETAKQLMATF